MDSLKLLKENPKVETLVKQWFLNKFLESMSDVSVPEDFKEFTMAQEMSSERLAVIINANPRIMMDIFDNNKIIISVSHDYTSGKFRYTFDGKTESVDFNTRFEAEQEAVKNAFKMLNDKL